MTEFKEATKNIEAPIDKLKAIILSNFNFLKKNPLYSELVSLFEINTQHTETPQLIESSMAITAFVLDIATKAKADGTFNQKVDPLLFTISLWGMTTGMVQLVKVRGPLIEKHQGITENQILENFLSIIESGFKK